MFTGLHRIWIGYAELTIVGLVEISEICMMQRDFSHAAMPFDKSIHVPAVTNTFREKPEDLSASCTTCRWQNFDETLF